MANKQTHELDEVTTMADTDEFPIYNAASPSEAKRVSKANVLKERDSTISSLSSTVSSLSSSLSSLSSTVSSLSSSLSSLSSTVSGIISATVATIVGYISTYFGIYSVRYYGAVGDNSTDDYSAIQACFNAANSAGGGTIVFPYGVSGIYIIGTKLTCPSNCVIMSAGGPGDAGTHVISRGYTVIKAKAGLNDTLIDMNNAVGTRFINITFDGNHSNSTGMLIDGRGYTIDGGGCNIFFEKCTFRECHGTQYAVQLSGLTTALLTDFTFRECHWYGCDGGCVVSTNAVWNKFHGCLVTNCTSPTPTYGIFRCSNANIEMTDCDMEGCDGTYVTAIGGAQVSTVCMISDNYFENSLDDTVIIIQSMSYINIENNQIITSTGSGIALKNFSETIVSGNIIHATAGTGGNGMYLEGSSSLYTITGNKCGGFTNGIQVVTGTHDYYLINSNNNAGCSSGVVDNGSGANKVIQHNL